MALYIAPTVKGSEQECPLYTKLCICSIK